MGQGMSFPGRIKTRDSCMPDMRNLSIQLVKAHLKNLYSTEEFESRLEAIRMKELPLFSSDHAENEPGLEQV